MSKYQGSCYCGEIYFKINGLCMGSQICHCSICRHLQSSSFGLVASFFAKDSIEITKGADSISEYLSPNKYSRLFCKKCGTRVFLSFEKSPIEIPMIVVYPTLLKSVTAPKLPQEFTPQRHIYYADRLYDFDDNIPKFINMPIEFGGSGEMLDSKGNLIS